MIRGAIAARLRGPLTSEPTGLLVSVLLIFPTRELYHKLDPKFLATCSHLLFT
jgi:hypothetical protein